MHMLALCGDTYGVTCTVLCNPSGVMYRSPAGLLFRQNMFCIHEPNVVHGEVDELRRGQPRSTATSAKLSVPSNVQHVASVRCELSIHWIGIQHSARQYSLHLPLFCAVRARCDVPPLKRCSAWQPYIRRSYNSIQHVPV